MKIFTAFLFAFVGLYIHGQDIYCTKADSLEFDRIVSSLSGLKVDNYGDRIVSVGKLFLNTPYVAHTLEVSQQEPLVVNFRGLDCTTYVENVLVFSRLSTQEDLSLLNYLDLLEEIRYRDSQRKGYSSRLHYFSEWLRNNEHKGWLSDIGAEIGGKEVRKKLDFMSKHRDSYSLLESDEVYQEILAIENSLNQVLCIVSLEELARNEKALQNGDIIALATNIKGLDVTHTGFAYRSKDGRVYLLHASPKGGVVLSDLPLVDYLKGIKHNIGVIVSRPQLPN